MSRTLRWTLALASLLVFIPLAAGSSQPRPGSLDPSFGLGGMVRVERSHDGDLCEATDVALQPDGKIILAGSTCGDLALARYRANGSVDPTFGTDGKVATDFGSVDWGNALALQSDGKIVVDGYTNDGTLLLARYNPDGSLDRSFGTEGKVTTTIRDESAVPRALGIQPDGKLIMAGYSGQGRYYHPLLLRYTQEGSLDPTFGSGGVVSSDFGTSSLAQGLALQQDGKILIAGSLSSADKSYFLISRFKRDGSLDERFGTNGKTVTDFGAGYAVGQGLALQPDGRIVVVGAARVPVKGGQPYRFALARYLRNGSLDPSFGKGGLTSTRTRLGSGAESVIVQPDGKLLVAGGVNVSYWNSDIAVFRYRSNGSLDPYFGQRGKVKTSVQGSDGTQMSGALLQPDGKIVLAATTWIHDIGPTGFALARYNGGTLHCVVPTLKGKRASRARYTIRRGTHCRVGRIKRVYSRTVLRGRVISQRPRAHTTHPAGTRVNLVVSKGKR